MMIQENLAVVESKIRSILSESDTNRRRQRYVASSNEIERKFVFLKNQLAATPHTDNHLSRLESLQATLTRFGDSLVHDRSLDNVDQGGSGEFKAYDNPCWESGAVEDTSVVSHRPVGVEEDCCGDYWRGLLVGVLSGAVAAVASVLPYAIRCRFDDAVTGSLFPPPT